MSNAAKAYFGEVRPVRVFPDAILKATCNSVQHITAETVAVLDDLVETMLALPRCVGLAAPQIGCLERLVVVDVSRAARPPMRHHGLLCLINPVIVLRSGSILSREGCVSVPEFTANVSRAERIALEYLDVDGNRRSIEAQGFEAIALQHEFDHLDGLLFLDRVRPEDIFKRSSTSRSR